MLQVFNLFGACGYIHSDKAKSFLSREFVSFMHGLRIPTSRTSIYNPTSNGQCEKYSDIIWSGVKLALKNKNMPISKWEVVLPQVFHSVRSLLCTATNATPHERFLNFQRPSVLGISVPFWLTSAGSVLVRRYARSSKYEPLVEKVDLIHATPQYALVRYKDGRETSVSLKNVAPISLENKSDPLSHLTEENSIPRNDEAVFEDSPTSIPNEDITPHEEALALENTPIKSPLKSDDIPIPRRSSRIRKSPDRLTYH